MIKGPEFKVFTAPHEILSRYDFRQGTFENSFTLHERRENYWREWWAIATEEEVVIFAFKNELSPHFINLSPRPIYVHNKRESFPTSIIMSFRTMPADQFFKLRQLRTAPNIQNGGLCVCENWYALGILHPDGDTVFCLCIDQSALVPLISQPLNCLTCKPSTLRPNQIKN